MSCKLMQALVILFTHLAVISPLHAQASAISGMADDLVKSLSAGSPKRVAVVDFTDLNSTTTQVGKYFAQELEVDLATSRNRIDLVNRSRLSELMKENKLDATGLTDPDTARRLGKIAGVQVLIVGTVTPLDEVVKLDVEAINTEDARVLAATSRNILKTRDILALLGQTSSSLEPAAPAAGVAYAERQGNVPQQTAKAAAPQIFESHDIQFSLNSCSREATAIVCKLTITNKADDRNIEIHAGTCNHPPSRLIDESGREFNANSVILGSRRDQFCIVEGTLVAGVPTRTEVRFENIPSSVTSISLLNLPSAIGQDKIDVSFHKVSLWQSRF